MSAKNTAPTTLRFRPLLPFLAWALSVALSAQGCGYSFRDKRNPWADQGIEKVYVQVVTNNSSRSGAEVFFTSAFVRTFSQGNKVRVVSDPKDADATIEASLDAIGNRINNATTVTQITDDPTVKTFQGTTPVVAEYQATADVTVKLKRTRDRKELWTKTFSRGRVYPGNNRYGYAGTTSALINDSVAHSALLEIAQGVADDAYDFMFEVF